MNGESDRKNKSCRDRSMSVNTDESIVSKESGIHSTCSMGTITGSNMSLE